MLHKMHLKRNGAVSLSCREEVEETFCKSENFVSAQFRFAIDAIHEGDGHLGQGVVELSGAN